MKFNPASTFTKIATILTGCLENCYFRNGLLAKNITETYAFIDGSGGGSHYSGITYDSFGSLVMVKHMEQTGTGNAYYFFPVNTVGYKTLKFITRCVLTAASGRMTIGLCPQSLGAPAAIVAGISAGNNLNSTYAGCREMRSVAVNQLNPEITFQDLASYQGDYYFYLETICTDATSASKYSTIYLYYMSCEV